MIRSRPAACPTADRLARLLSDECPADAELESHVEQCPHCQALLEQLAIAEPSAEPRSPPDSDENRFVDRLKEAPPTGWAVPGLAARQAFYPVWAAPPPPLMDGQPHVGGYELLTELGRGGMGVVYKARDLRLGRIVALKFLPTGTADGPVAAARFRREAEAAARLQHPGIVAVHAVGEHENRPYLVLEFVDGGTLASRLDGTPLPALTAAALIEPLAWAAEFAHRRGVIHRDIKPANILLAADGSPKLADFGLARLVDAPDGPTQDGVLLGTPSYMAPEQAASVASAQTGSTTAAADVYGLGAVLYELLTGRPPFRAETPLETLVQVVHLDPVPPCRLRPAIPKDLETICLKCLEKDPARRYKSAAELAADLARFRAGEPVLARPISRRRRIMNWVRRHPAPAALFALSVVLPCGAAGVGWWQWQLAEARAVAEERAKLAEGRERAVAEWRATESAVNRYLDLCESGAVAAGMLGLAHTLPRTPPEALAWDRLARLNLASWRDRVLVQRFSIPLPDAVLTVAYRPDGLAAIVGLANGTAQIWNVETGEPLGPPLPHGGPVRHVAFHSVRPLVLTGGDDGTVRFWDASTGHPLPVIHRHNGPVRRAEFTADGRWAVSAGADGSIWRWDGDSRSAHELPMRHSGPLLAFAMSPEGQRFVTAGDNGAILWTGNESQRSVMLLADRPVTAAAFSPDGRRVVTADRHGDAMLWDAQTGTSLGMPLHHAVPLHTIHFSRDGQVLVTGGGFPDSAGEVRLWDVDSGRPLGPTLPHPRAVHTVAISPDGRHVLAAGHDWRAILWLAAGDHSTSVPIVHLGAVTTAAVSPTGRGFLTACTPNAQGHRAELKIHRFPSDASFGPTLEHPAPVSAIAVRPDGQIIATGCADGQVRLWSWPEGQRCGPPLPMTNGFAVRALAFTPNATELAAGDEKGLLRRWDAITGQSIGQPINYERAIRSLAYSPEGHRLAIGGLFPTVRVIDRETGAVVAYPHPADAAGVAFSPNGSELVTACSDTRVHFWESDIPRRSSPPLVFGLTARIVAFLPNGHRVVCGGAGREVRIWDLLTRANAIPPLLLPDAVTSLAVSPTGELIATACLDGTAYLWDVMTGKRASPAWLQGVAAVAFSPDGHTLFAGGPRGTVRAWAVPTPVAGSPLQVIRWAETATGSELLADGTLRALSDADTTARRRALQEAGLPVP